MAVLGGLGGNYKRMTVIHLSEDGLSASSSHPEDSFFTSFDLRIRDLCVNPHTGALYVAFNGSSYPGSGPNAIKEFRNLDYEVSAVQDAPVQSIQVYPNPVAEKLQVEFSTGFIGQTVEVLSFSGQQVFTGKIASAHMELDCSDYASGKYFLRATSPLGTVSRTFVVN
jgi:hypothetical protein